MFNGVGISEYWEDGLMLAVIKRALGSLAQNDLRSGLL